jgi:hypothetical protein
MVLKINHNLVLGEQVPSAKFQVPAKIKYQFTIFKERRWWSEMRIEILTAGYCSFLGTWNLDVGTF